MMSKKTYKSRHNEFSIKFALFIMPILYIFEKYWSMVFVGIVAILFVLSTILDLLREVQYFYNLNDWSDDE